MALTEYDRGDLIYKGSILADVQVGGVDVGNGAQDVMTIRKGYAGFSKGSVVGSINCDFAVPKAGMEQDWVTVITKQRAVKLMCVVGGLKFEVEGPLKGLSIKFGENQHATGSFTVHGTIRIS